MKMSTDGKGLVSLRGEWLLWVVVLAVIMLSQATMVVGDDIGIPSTGLLCISNCATCPLICSPPPVVTSLPLPPPPPPPEQFLPPQSYYVPQSPPPPPPLQYSYFPLTPPLPPTNYPMNTPFAPSPPYNGPHDYSYPYYFFYASACLSLPVFFSYFLVPLLCWSLVFPFW